MKIFDIGTNRGHFTDEYISKYPDSKIICIEANPELCNKLVNKYKDNPNIEVYHYLISDKSNIDIDFFIPTLEDWDGVGTANPKWVTHSRFNNLSWKNPIQVESITLDELIENTFTPDMIKIDIEGYESIAIRGLTKKIELIQFEWASEAISLAEDVCIYLKSIGYNQFAYKFEDQPYSYLPMEFFTLEEIDLFKNFNWTNDCNWGMIYAK